MPKVSIIIAAYNAEKYLDRCLRSIADQTMPYFEAIIVDDGSTDGTARIAQSYVERDKRFHLIEEKQNCGQSKARQDAIRAHYKGNTEKEIIDFLEAVVFRGEDPMREVRNAFYEKYLRPPGDKSVSESIYQEILSGLGFAQ